MNSNQQVTEQQQSEILRLIMENTSDLKENNVRHSSSGLRLGQILKNPSSSKVQTIDPNHNTDITRKRSVFDK